LSTPETDVETEEGESEDGLKYGVSSMQGWRAGMEDAHVVDLAFDSDAKLSLLGVFDGHGGPEVALYCQKHMAEALRDAIAVEGAGCPAGSSHAGSGSGGADGESDGAETKADRLSRALVRSFLDLDVRLGTREGVREMKRWARAEDQRRAKTIEETDLEEAAEAAEACGLTVAQMRALVASQIKARHAAKYAEDDQSDDEAQENVTEAQEGRVGAAGAGRAESGRLDAVAEADSSSPVGSDLSSSSSSSGASAADSSSSGGESGAEPVEASTTSGGADGEPGTAAAALSAASPPTGASAGRDRFAALRPRLRKGGVGVDSGATSVVCLLGEHEVIVANAGDSRCVAARAEALPEESEPGPSGGSVGDSCEAVARGGSQAGEEGGQRRVRFRFVAEDLSEDHKPEDPGELARIEAAGGSVTEGRVQGNLNLSRAIGDLLYKSNLDAAVEAQMISALPDIRRAKLSRSGHTAAADRVRDGGRTAQEAGGDPSDLAAGDVAFLVLACDGIWNSMESQEVVDFVAERLFPQPQAATDPKAGGTAAEEVKDAAFEAGREKREKPLSLGTICEEVMLNCLAPDTEGDGSGCDNMTMMVVVPPPRRGATAAKTPAAEAPAAEAATTKAAEAGKGSRKRPASLRDSPVGEKGERKALKRPE